MATEAKHTPGPWNWKPRHHVINESAVLSPDPHSENGGFVVAHTYGPKHAANARLIATAPVLLESLKTARDAIASVAVETFGVADHGGLSDPYPIQAELLHNIDAAIAKAEGRSDA
ncbi:MULTISPECIES: hypothetical protein [Chelativorans]|jgi:hypothetical protein|nr:MULTISPECIES: hypothetical protein [Chelativorans]